MVMRVTARKVCVWARMKGLVVGDQRKERWGMGR